MTSTPVITIDGPSGTGKGTIAALLAEKLRFHLLDSGALYRAVAWAALDRAIDLKSQDALNPFLREFKLELRADSPTSMPKIFYEGRDIHKVIRSEEVGNMASKVAAIPVVRAHLLGYQRMMRTPPGLIADGRDMGSVIFPDALVKFYLDARVEVRAERRYKQLKKRGIGVSLREVQEDLSARDYRDEHRKISPTIATPDMTWIDTSELSVDEVFVLVIGGLPSELLGDHSD